LRESNYKSGGSSASQATSTDSGRTGEIRSWLIEHLARELEIDPSKIDPDRPLTRYGLDSLAAVTLSGELEVFLKRELSPELLRELPTINAIANRFGEGSEAVEPPREPTRYASLDYSDLTIMQRRLQRAIRGIASPLYRIDIQGLENFPKAGAFIIAANHLHILDAPLLFSMIPRSIVMFASDHMRRVPLVGWFLRQAGNAIYVRPSTRSHGDFTSGDAIGRGDRTCGDVGSGKNLPPLAALITHPDPRANWRTAAIPKTTRHSQTARISSRHDHVRAGPPAS
jgi:acyl carrier protein